MLGESSRLGKGAERWQVEGVCSSFSWYFILKSSNIKDVSALSRFGGPSRSIRGQRGAPFDALQGEAASVLLRAEHLLRAALPGGWETIPQPEVCGGCFAPRCPGSPGEQGNARSPALKRGAGRSEPARGLLNHLELPPPGEQMLLEKK